jgi:protein subunit release factor B
MIGKEKFEELQRRMELLGIREDDIIEKFILGSGKGGQKVNKDLLLRLSEAYSHWNRGQNVNKIALANSIGISPAGSFVTRFEFQINKVKTEEQQLFEKIRRQKRRRSRRSKDKMLGNKKHHGEKKNLRQSPESFD